jgi:hypothetical protein
LTRFLHANRYPPRIKSGQLSLENALGSFTFPAGVALHCDIRSSTIAASDGGRRSLNKAPDQTIGQSRP